MSTFDKMLQEIEEDVKANPALRAMRWWKQIMNPKSKDWALIQKVMVDVCKRNPKVVLALKDALVKELDSMLKGDSSPEVEIDY